MVHHVTILEFTAKTVSFALGGASFRARHAIDAEEFEKALKSGAALPLELGVEAVAPVDYLTTPAEGMELVTQDAAGDMVAVRGRVADYLAHDAVRLDGAAGARVLLKRPQMATDFRRGSWLTAQGRLTAALPGDDHDETGLRTL